eukprot:766988-Hanusia_phi.AAC.1
MFRGDCNAFHDNAYVSPCRICPGPLVLKRLSNTCDHRRKEQREIMTNNFQRGDDVRELAQRLQPMQRQREEALDVCVSHEQVLANQFPVTYRSVSMEARYILFTRRTRRLAVCSAQQSSSSMI